MATDRDKARTFTPEEARHHPLLRRLGPLPERTLMVYIKEGKRGVVLESYRVGGRRYIDESAIEEFARAVAATPPRRRRVAAKGPRWPRERPCRSKEARRMTERAGA